MPRPLEVLVSGFVDHLHDRHLAPLTVLRYGGELRRLVRFLGRECPAALDAPGAIDKALLILHLRNGQVLPRPQAPSTWNLRLTALRWFFGYALRERALTADPSIDITYARVPDRTPSYLTRPEYMRLLRAIETHASDHYRARDLAICITLWNTGMRVGELVSLDREQVDFAAERFCAVRLKGGKVDDIHANVEVVVAIRRWLLVRPDYRHASAEPALFLSERGRQISIRAVEDLFAKYAALARLGKRVTPHAMRHSAATELVRLGVPMPVVADALRHRKTDTTRRYIHVAGVEVHAAVALLGSLPASRRRRVAR